MARAEPSFDELVAALTAEQLREVVRAAAGESVAVERQVRLIAARSSGDLVQLRAELGRALRRRGYLGYRESTEWALAARPVVHELQAAVDAAPSRELVELLEHAVGRVVKVMLHADDSDGMIGDVARDLLELHARACDAGVADPGRLARWMVRFWFVDQDLFTVDPVRYASALGDDGLAIYRSATAAHAEHDSFAARYARERLAILDGDAEALVHMLGGDLTRPHQFIAVAEAMRELGRESDVLAWAMRGIADTDGWQVAKLYDLACAVHVAREEPLEVLRLRREQHERMPSAATYRALRAAADAVDAWPTERPAARSILQCADARGHIDVLLADGDVGPAWEAASAAGWEAIGSEAWLKLAETRAQEQPLDALRVYQRVVDEVLADADRRAYQSAARILKQARSAARAAGAEEDFASYLARLRDQHRRRPTLIAILDKAGLD